jgi:hypothetical protein
MVTNGYVLQQPPRNTVLIDEHHIPLAHLEGTLQGEYVTSLCMFVRYHVYHLVGLGPLTTNTCTAFLYIYVQFSIRKVLGYLTPGLERLGREADSTLLCSTVVKNGYRVIRSLAL